MKLAGFVKIALLASLAALLMIFLQVPFPPAPFIKYDPSDTATIIGALALGPMEGVALAFVKDLIFLLVKGGEGGGLGAFMDFIAGASMAVLCGSIYRIRKTKAMATLALVVGILGTTALMIPANYLVLPLFIRPQTALTTFILCSVVPFNLLKGLFNSLLVLFLYKRLSHFLKAVKSEGAPSATSTLQKEKSLLL
ncbi:MAG: ECF transporter S component [bacterium]